MATVKRTAVALVIAGLGVCGALPFLRPAPAPSPSPEVADLSLQEEFVVAPLHISSQPETSPAVGLTTSGAYRRRAPFLHVPLANQPTPLETIAPPPEFPTNYQPLLATEGAETARRIRFHTLRDGDTLERLAQRYLGNPAAADEIFQANRSVLTRPDILPIGAEIRIPEGE